MYNSKKREKNAQNLNQVDPNLLKRNIEHDPRCKASDIAIQADVTPKAANRYLHQLGYCGETVRRKPLLRPTNIKGRNDRALDMMVRSQTFRNIVILSDESRFTLFSEIGRVWVWRMPSQEFDLK